MEKYDVVIIGGGVAGLAAAMYAGRLKMKTMLSGELIGGTITLTNLVENYPGFEKISGAELAERIRKHAESYGVNLKNGRVVSVAGNADGYKVSTNEESFETKTVIFATGTEWRKLGVPGEKEFFGRGVHYCALCDGAFYKDKVIGIVGGSDTAAKEALLLAEYGKKIYIIYRREKIRAEPITAERVEKNKKIEVIANTNVLEIRGKTKVGSVVFDKPYKGRSELKLDGIFVAIGHVPLSDIAAKLGVKTNEKREIIIDREAKTNLKGVYAAGDVTDSTFKQAVTGVAEGVRAAYSAYMYIRE